MKNLSISAFVVKRSIYRFGRIVLNKLQGRPFFF